MVIVVVQISTQCRVIIPPAALAMVSGMNENQVIYLCGLIRVILCIILMVDWGLPLNQQPVCTGITTLKVFLVFFYNNLAYMHGYNNSKLLTCVYP